MFTEKFQAWVRASAQRLVRTLPIHKVNPNALTLAGLVITCIAAVLIGSGFLLAGGIVLLLAAAFDILDGAVARATNHVRKYGAFLDSTTDRYAESATYLALLTYFLFQHAPPLICLMVMVSLEGSLLVSYVRARAQSLGFACEGGLFARPERVILTVIGLVIPYTLVAVVVLLAIATNVTAIQRILIVWKQDRAHLVPEKDQ